MAVDLDPQLREILACPCPAHAPLRDGTAADPDAGALTCTVCGRSFPVTDGIPVLLLNEALAGTSPSIEGVQGGEGRGSGSGSG